jgi:hypothetical protein
MGEEITLGDQGEWNEKKESNLISTIERRKTKCDGKGCPWKRIVGRKHNGHIEVLG